MRSPNRWDSFNTNRERFSLARARTNERANAYGLNIVSESTLQKIARLLPGAAVVSMCTMRCKFLPCCVQPLLHLTLNARITSKLYLPRRGNTRLAIDIVDSPDPIYLCSLFERTFKPIILSLLLGVHAASQTARGLPANVISS